MTDVSPNKGSPPQEGPILSSLSQKRWFWLTAVFCAGLAAAIAFTTLLAARHARQALLADVQAADGWNYYQAKAIKENILAAKVELIRNLGSTPKEHNELKAREYKLELTRLYNDAKNLELSASSHREMNRMYVGYVGFFQICMAMAVVAVLLHRMALLDHTRRGLQSAIAERRDLERKFIQAQKLEAVGRLAAGVAHDFNNLLTVINGYSERMVENPSNLREIDEPARQIRDAGLKGAALTRQLLGFTRKLPLAIKPLNLNSVVESMSSMLRRLLGADIEFTTRLEPGLGWTDADENQISQVVMNLSVNARDAMRNGGSLTISTRNSATAKGLPADAPESPQGWVCIEVTDTGSGMSKEVLGNVFEPFFTTKEVGKGTGLGMSTCLHVVSEHHGRIDLQSEPGKGTIACVYFPRSNRPVDQPLPASEPEGDMPAGDETILLAEDEPAVRELGAMLLREMGYNVLEADDGLAALAILQAPGMPRPSLIISDLVMPTMGGFELARRVATRHPDMPLLFTSGYSGEEPPIDDTIKNPWAFLSKPYSPRDLAIHVRKLIDKTKPALAPA